MKLPSQQRLVMVRGQLRRYSRSSLPDRNLEVRLLRRRFCLDLRCLFHVVPREMTPSKTGAIAMPQGKIALTSFVVNRFVSHPAGALSGRSKINRRRVNS